MKDENLIDRQLALAWQGLRPPSDLRERVRARLGDFQPSAPSAPPRGAGDGSGLRMLRASGKVGIAAGTGIFVLGFLAGRLAPTAVSAAPPERKAAEQVAAASVEQSGSSTEIDEAMTAPPQEPAPSSAPDLPVLPKTAKSRAVPEASSASRTATPSARDWRAELELLERAERALRADNVALSLALLAEFDARHPRSALREERGAIEVMAQCQIGATDGSARAERFLRVHGQSVYAARIRELCEPKSTSPSAAESLTKPRGSGHEAR